VKTFQREVQLRTAGGLTVTDITREVSDAVRESGVQNGICCVYSPHTTCSVRVNEWERGFLEDFAVMLKRLVPTEHYYAHDDWDRRTENICEEDMDFGNGHSHCMAMLLGTAGESVPAEEITERYPEFKFLSGWPSGTVLDGELSNAPCIPH
jgi:secondary thiamine-phosphate synthase enzyme